MTVTTSSSLAISTNRSRDKKAVTPGLVTVRVLAARNISSAEMFGSADSFVQVTYSGQVFTTKVIGDDNNPTYNEDFVSPAGLVKEGMIQIKVFEKYLMEDVLIGETGFQVGSFEYHVMEPTWIALERDGTDEGIGDICIAARFTPMALPPMAKGQSGIPESNGPVEQAVQYFSGPRPWYLRAGFYYDLSKNVYRRARGMPVLSLAGGVSESVFEGVLSHTVLRPIPGIADSSVVRLDYAMCGIISKFDVGIDQAKDEVLRKAVDLKQKIVAGAGEGKSRGGRIWGVVEGTVQHIAKPVASYVPIIGGLVVRTLDYIVPPPSPAEIPNSTTPPPGE